MNSSNTRCAQTKALMHEVLQTGDRGLTFIEVPQLAIEPDSAAAAVVRKAADFKLIPARGVGVGSGSA
jgi:hypothetical protein